MRRNGDIYEYISVYVDNLAITARDPKGLCEILIKKYKYKLKGTGPISFHLGCDFLRDVKGVLCMAPKKFVDKLCMLNERHFGKNLPELWLTLREKISS